MSTPSNTFASIPWTEKAKSLRKAIKNNDVEQILFFLQTPEDFYEKQQPLFREACETTSLETVKLFVEAGLHKRDMSTTQDAFRVACYSNSPEKLDYLIGIGYNPSENAGHGYISAATRGAVNIMKYIETEHLDLLFQKSIYFYALSGALESVEIEAINYLLQKPTYQKFEEEDFHKLWYIGFEAIERMEQPNFEGLDKIYNFLQNKIKAIEQSFVRNIHFEFEDKEILNYLLNKDPLLIEKLAEGKIGSSSTKEYAPSVQSMLEVYLEKKELLLGVMEKSSVLNSDNTTASFKNKI